MASVRFNQGGTVELRGFGAAGLAYTVQATDSLVRPMQWRDISFGSADAGGVFTFIDAQASQHRQRFYRLVRP